MENNILLSVHGIHKNFGDIRALKGVDMVVRRGEIHGLIGENGSGKSTLSGIIAGIQPASSGSMELCGKPYAPRNMLEAQAAGISMVVQEMATVDGLTVAENILLGKEKQFGKWGVVSTKKLNEGARQALENIGLRHINPGRIINSLSLEERKLVEIARAMREDPQLFIVDETTTAISQMGRSVMYAHMKRLREEGKSVLFISHDLDELIEHCDCLTVLRDGDKIADLDRSEFEPERIKQLMVGREVAENYYRSDYDGSHSGQPALVAENLSSLHVLPLDLTLHKGEILGVAGLSGSGMHELGRLLFGIDKAETGTVRVGEKEITSVRGAIDAGMAYVSKNRDQEALVLEADIADNITAPNLDWLRHCGLISKKKERKLVAEQVEALRIKCQSPGQTVSTLSGGNKQKVSFAKWMGRGSGIFILDCPTRGIDIGVKASMYQLMTELKHQGHAILLISEELTELIGMCDRIMVMKYGRVTAELQRSETLQESDIIRKMI